MSNTVSYMSILKEAIKEFDNQRIFSMEDIENHLIKFAPKLFTEIDLKPGHLRVHVPRVMVDKVLESLKDIIPANLDLVVLPNEYDVW